MSFDARAAKALQAGQHITFPEHPGLRFVVAANWRRWIYRYKSPVDDRMRQVQIGYWPAVSYNAAVTEWALLRAKRDAGVDPSVEAKEVRQAAREAEVARKIEIDIHAYTVRVLCDDYLSGHIAHHRNKNGRRTVGSMFDTMLGDIESLPAVDVTRAVAFDTISRHIGSAPVQAKNLRAELGAAWDFAIDAGRIPDDTPNWWRLILRGKIKSRGKKIGGDRVGTVKRILADDELRLLIPWIPNFPNTIGDACLMYLWTATRGAEIVVMRGDEVTLEGDQWWWTIPKEKTKNERHERAFDHRVPLVGRALEVVNRRKNLYGNGYLFPMRDRSSHVQQKYLSEQVYFRQPYCKIRPESLRPRLPVSHWAPHDLRRTSRTILAKIGCPEPVGESILGHMLPGVSGIYNLHKYDDEKRIWLLALSRYLESLIAVS